MVQSRGVLDKNVIGRVTMPDKHMSLLSHNIFMLYLLITTKKYISRSSITSHQGLSQSNINKSIKTNSNHLKALSASLWPMIALLRSPARAAIIAVS